MSVFSLLLGAREIADRYGAEEVIAVEVLVEVDVVLSGDADWRVVSYIYSLGRVALVIL